MDQPLPVIDDVLAQVRAGRALDVALVERATGATLRETDDSNGSFSFYEAHGIRSGGYTLRIDLRTPVRGGDATSGALFSLDLDGPCIHRADMEGRYGPLTLTDAPRGVSLDEEASWSRQEPWGRLSFGFAERAPDCLRTIVFNVKK